MSGIVLESRKNNQGRVSYTLFIYYFGTLKDWTLICTNFKGWGADGYGGNYDERTSSVFAKGR